MRQPRPALLLVESELEALHVLPGFMRRVGDVRVEASLHEAVASVRERPVDVMVASNRLLATDGRPLVTLVKQAQPCAQILLLCEAATTEVPAWLVAEGVGDVIVKPFDVASLEPRLERLLEVMREHQRRLRSDRDLCARMRHQERVALLGTLVATLAHDVANPLSVIVTNASMVGEIVGGDALIEGEDRSFLRTANEDTMAAANAIRYYCERVLRFSRQDAAHRWDDDLGETLRTAVLFVGPRVRSHGAHLHVDWNEPSLRVSHHAAAFSQAVVNALTNAVDAAGENGNVWLAVEDNADEVVVVVDDDGPGMTEEQHRRLGEAFFTTKERGTGLGTVVIQQVMHEHGGRATWSNRDDRGVSVRLCLPKRPSSLPPSRRFVTK